MVKDTISNLIVSLKNASATGKDYSYAPATKVIISILDVLKKKNYIEDYEIVGEDPKKQVKVSIKYENGNPAIHGVKRVSKFSQRIYKGFKSIQPVKSGYGMMILTTPKGILTDKEATDQKVGGEALFMIW
jgi:small subunit ribosomal protein S8